MKKILSIFLLFLIFGWINNAIGNQDVPNILLFQIGSIQGKEFRKVSFSPDSKFLAFVNNDKKAAIFDIDRKKIVILSESKDVEYVLFSPDGKFLATTEGQEDRKDRVIRLWDLSTHKKIRTLSENYDARQPIAFSPDDTMLAATTKDGVILWNLETGKILQKFKFCDYSKLESWERCTDSVAFNHDGSILAVGVGHLSGLKLIDVRTGTVVNNLVYPDTGYDATYGTIKYSPFSVVFSSDGKLLATTGRRYSYPKSQFALAPFFFSPPVVFDTTTGNLIRIFRGRNLKYDPLLLPDADAFFSANGTILVTIGDAGATFWDISTGREIVAFGGDFYSGALSPDGKVIALVRRKDGNISLWAVVNLSDILVSRKYDDVITLLNRAIENLKTPVLKTNFGLCAIQGDYPAVVVIDGRVDLKLGDKIISINGQSTKGLDLEKIEQMLRETKNEQIVLTIEKRGVDKPLEKKFNIKKEEIAQSTIINNSASSLLGLSSLIYALKGDYEQASKSAEMAYSLNPEDIWSKIARSFSYAKKGDLKKSTEIYKLIPEEYLESQNALIHYFKNVLLESFAPYVESKKESVKALETNGQYREVLKEYAELLKIADQTKRKEILDHVAVLLKKQPYLMELPEEARKYALRAEMMTKEGKFAEAVKEYKEAIRIAPFYPLLYKAIALNYAELKDYKKAIENMNTYIELYPDASDVRAAKDEIY